MWKLALHSVSYAGVWPGQASLSLEEFLNRAADLGFAGVMLMAKRGHASLLEMPSGRRQVVRDQMRRRGLELAAIASYTNFTAGADRPDIPLLEMQILYVRECARLAQDLGGGIVRIFTGYECPELTPAQSWQRCVQTIKECGRQVAEFGVMLAVQNHHDIGVHHSAMRDLLEQVNEPNVKAGFDAWAPALQGLAGEELANAVRVMAPYIRQTIVADYVRQPRFRYHPALTNYTAEPDNLSAVPVGEGIIDYHSFFNALREVGYDGWVTYEICSSIRGGGTPENLDRAGRHFIEWMASIQQR